MFDTMTSTKLIGAFCGTFLVFLLANMAAESLYHVGSEDHGDGHDQAYVIEVAEAGHGKEVDEGPSFAEELLWWSEWLESQGNDVEAADIRAQNRKLDPAGSLQE